MLTTAAPPPLHPARYLYRSREMNNTTITEYKKTIKITNLGLGMLLDMSRDQLYALVGILYCYIVWTTVLNKGNVFSAFE